MSTPTTHPRNQWSDVSLWFQFKTRKVAVSSLTTLIQSKFISIHPNNKNEFSFGITQEIDIQTEMVLIRRGHLVFINRQAIKFLNMSNIACNMLCNHEYSSGNLSNLCPHLSKAHGWHQSKILPLWWPVLPLRPVFSLDTRVLFSVKWVERGGINITT